MVAGYSLPGSLCAAPQENPIVPLPRIPPTEPKAAHATFRLRPGFRIEQVAAEPLVTDPIAIAFDEKGRLFVAEMRGYSERREESLGRIRLLTDHDGDGKYDDSRIFADQLRWPTGLICWKGGLFVLASPDLLFLPDENGDDRADEQKVIFTGFGSGRDKLNVQALPNSLTWGPDNRIHGATAMNGGEVGRPGQRSTLTSLNGRDFSFDPGTLDLRAENGGGQYGMSFDSAGRKFVCSNSNHLQWIPFQASFNSPRLTGRPIEIAVDGPSAEVFRTSPDEPWRIVRTRWRMNGEVAGPVEGGGRPSGYFTAATGITIYRGNSFPKGYSDNAFVCDAGSNLVHRKIIEPSDGKNLLEGRRAVDESEIEFVTSTDNWFRPVQATNGPDGSLYIVDMYRETIEHPWSLPEPLKSQLDLNSGNDRGRIYRVVPDQFTQPALPSLDELSHEKVVSMLGHSNGWHRDTAARLLLEREPSPSIPMLQRLVTDASPVASRIAAIQTLASMGALNEELLIRGLRDSDRIVRRKAISLVTNDSPSRVQKALRSLTRDIDPEVSFAASLAVSRASPSVETRLSLIAAIETHPNRYFCRMAALSGLEKTPDESMAAALSSHVILSNPEAFDVLQILLSKNSRPLPPSVSEKLQQLLSQIVEPLPRAAFVSASGIPMPNTERQSLAQAMTDIANNSTASVSDRILAISHLPHLTTTEEHLPSLTQFLSPDRPPAIQKAALTAIGRSQLPAAGEVIVSHWQNLATSLQRLALNQLFQQPAWRDTLLEGLEDKTIPLTLLQPQQINSLRSAGSDAQRARAHGLLTSSVSSRELAPRESYSRSLELKGNALAGKEHFSARCASCHRKEGLGERFGPDVSTFQNAGAATILSHILDPERELQPRYASVSITTKEAALHMGYIVSENESTVTLREVATGDRVIERHSIDKIERSNTSPMPKGLETGMTQQQMADLLAFIISN